MFIFAVFTEGKKKNFISYQHRGATSQPITDCDRRKDTPLPHLCARSGHSRAARTVNEEQHHPELAGGGCDAQHLVKNSAGIALVSTNLGQINPANSIPDFFFLCGSVAP